MSPRMGQTGDGDDARRVRSPELFFPGLEIDMMGELVFELAHRLFFLPLVEIVLADEHGPLLDGARRSRTLAERRSQPVRRAAS